MRKSLVSLIGAAALLSFFTVPALAAPPSKADKSPPIVVNTAPANHAKNVPLNQTISVRYNEALQSVPVKGRLTSTSGKAEPVKVHYNRANNSFVFVPGMDTPLDYATSYTATLQVKDVKGNQSSPLTLSFTTMAAPAIPTPPARPRPINNDCSGGNVEFTFDDGPDTHAQLMLSTLHTLNIKAVFFVIGDRVYGEPAGAQAVRDEVAQGHLVENHTYDHTSFTGNSTGTEHLTTAQITDELEHNSAVLVAAGVPKPTLYRAPYGDIDAYSDTIARNLGYRVVAPWQLQANTGVRILDSKDWTGISASEIASNVLNGFTANGWFHPGIAADAVIGMHDGGDTAPNTIASLQSIVDYMNTYHLCATTTIPADATGGVTPLPAPDEPTTGNLVQNPSLETIPAGNTQPTCFLQSGATTASNAATWSVTTDAHSGAMAQEVDETAWTGGDRKLVISQLASKDSCVAPLTAGQSVRVWIWYKGTWNGYGGPLDQTRVGLVTYYRTAAGVFKWWTSSPLVPPSDSWALASTATPPLPAGATGVSFGLAIQGVGTLITDDYALAVQ
jgi:peptidoglycan/xylan/chitin deacetylase (PgdA/CDA1 family)